MADNERPRRASTGSIIGGVFLVLLALCLIFAGGGCTILLFAMGSPSSEMVPFLLLSLAVLGAGAVAMWFGVRLIGGYYD